ncbi:unannotated protein [freshwater metagenome]|uniref:Unannotated protein n=1 Tax=freshwater metagenome TaxID=449393 RepID=A0A6J6BXQ5_9ZZZZ
MIVSSTGLSPHHFLSRSTVIVRVTLSRALNLNGPEVTNGAAFHDVLKASGDAVNAAGLSALKSGCQSGYVSLKATTISLSVFPFLTDSIFSYPTDEVML